MGDQGPGLQGPVVSLYRRLSHTHRRPAGLRVPHGIPGRVGGRTVRLDGLGAQGGRLGQAAAGRRRGQPDQGPRRDLHRRPRRRLGPADARSDVGSRHGLQRGLAGRGLRQQVRGMRVSAPISGPGGEPLPAQRRLARPSDPGDRPPRADPADQRVDQDQLAVAAGRSGRLRGDVGRAGRRPAADPRGGPQAQRAGELRHGTVGAQGSHPGAVPAIVRGGRVPRRDCPAGVPAECGRRRAADHRLGQAERPAGHGPAGQGGLLGFRCRCGPPSARRTHVWSGSWSPFWRPLRGVLGRAG